MSGSVSEIIEKGEGHAIACYNIYTSEGQSGAPLQMSE